MKKIVFFLAVIVMTAACCSQSNSASNTNATTPATQTTTAQPAPANKTAVVFRIGRYVQKVGYSSCSRTVIWLSNGKIFDVTDSRDSRFPLLREGDTVVYYVDKTFQLVDFTPK